MLLPQADMSRVTESDPMSHLSANPYGVSLATTPCWQAQIVKLAKADILEDMDELYGGNINEMLQES
jgi:hypothetical protein